jgi:hypothetical protein
MLMIGICFCVGFIGGDLIPPSAGGKHPLIAFGRVLESRLRIAEQSLPAAEKSTKTALLIARLCGVPYLPDVNLCYGRNGARKLRPRGAGRGHFER